MAFESVEALPTGYSTPSYSPTGSAHLDSSSEQIHQLLNKSAAKTNSYGSTDLDPSHSSVSPVQNYNLHQQQYSSPTITGAISSQTNSHGGQSENTSWTPQPIQSSSEIMFPFENCTNSFAQPSWCYNQATSSGYYPQSYEASSAVQSYNSPQLQDIYSIENQQSSMDPCFQNLYNYHAYLYQCANRMGYQPEVPIISRDQLVMSNNNAPVNECNNYDQSNEVFTMVDTEVEKENIVPTRAGKRIREAYQQDNQVPTYTSSDYKPPKKTKIQTTKKSCGSINLSKYLDIVNLIPPQPTNGAQIWLNVMAPFSSMCVSQSSPEAGQVQISIKEQRIWSELYSCKSEMIANNTGRRIFPSLSINIQGLNPDDNYVFYLDMVMTQPFVFKHSCGNWIVASNAEPYPPNSINSTSKIYLQEEGSKPGRYWMDSGVNFTKAKITNNKDVGYEKNMIYVYSMHNYLPRFNIAKVTNILGEDTYTHFGSYIISGTEFYTVTAYQNPDVIKVKIKSNPFAKGFRNKQNEYNNGELQAILHNFNMSTKGRFN